jgi:hypothetical protein
MGAMPSDAATGLPALTAALGVVVGALLGGALVWLAVRGTAQAAAHAATRATAQAIQEGQRTIAQELVASQRAVGEDIIAGHRAVADDEARRERRARQVQDVLDLAERRLALYARLRQAAGAFDGTQARAVTDQLHGEQTLLGEAGVLGAVDARVREAAEAFAATDAQCETAIKGLFARGDLHEVATTIGDAMPALLAATEALHRESEAYIFSR